MDRETLTTRNRQLAEAFHSPPVRHRLRRTLIQAAAHFPFTPCPTARVRRVLFIRPDHLGDMLLATPAIRAFKAARPFVEVHVLAGAWAAPVLAGYSEIDRVLTIPFPGFNRHETHRSPLAPYTQLVRVSRQLRLIGYAAAVLLRPDHWWGAMLAHAAGIQERIGYDLPDVAPFLTQRVAFRHEHVIRQNLRLVEHWTGQIDDEDVPYSLPVFDDDRDFIRAYLETCGIPARQTVICLHPGSGTWAKQWDGESWAKVADTLIEQAGADIIFTGSDHELPLVTSIMNRMRYRAFTVAGDLNIGQLAALYERAQVVLGPDSGPLHIAAAVGTPTVALYGPADPVEFGTWGSRQQHLILTAPIACRPCRVLDWGDDAPDFHPCVRDISIGQVLEAARRLLAHR